MSQLLTQSIQDYLKYIYELNEKGCAASTTELAAKLQFAPASVTGMLQKLASSKPPLVRYQKHQGVTLTPEGERAALEVIRHHRLLETYLVQALGYSWDEVHQEACRLEHVISEDFETRIAAALGHPARDPHGDPIPSQNLRMPQEEIRPLVSLGVGEAGTVKRVANDNPALLRYLSQIGLVPNVRVVVEGVSEIDGNLTVRITDQKTKHVLGTAITRQVFVHKQERSR
jgi:DtxR family Mn-dependent transcriptional regulator